MKKRNLMLAVLLLCGSASLAQAQGTPVQSAPVQSSATQTAPLPAWEQLTPAQRDELIAPMRDRWNRSPEDRQKMYDHAHRWQKMTPDQRREARKGMHRWERMDPQKREEARALFDRMRTMSPEQRDALRKQWRTMTPEQRKLWIENNPPKKP